MCSHCSELHNKLWSKNDKPCNELLHRNSNMDLKMHIYSVPLRIPFAFPCVPWNFEVGERLWPEIRGGELGSPASYYTLTTGVKVLTHLRVTMSTRIKQIFSHKLSNDCEKITANVFNWNDYKYDTQMFSCRIFLQKNCYSIFLQKLLFINNIHTTTNSL